ncbi:MAG: ABC transporter substrate-binding protein, partial [Chloroflexi bacterium]
LAPEVILLPGGSYPFVEADKAAFANYTEVPAVRSRRIHLIDGSLLFWAGTRLAKALTEIPPLLSESK